MKKIITLIAATILTVSCVSLEESPYENLAIDDTDAATSASTTTSGTSVLTYFNGGAGVDRFTAVQRDSSGNYYLLGHTAGNLFNNVGGSTAPGDTDSSKDDIILVKLDKNEKVVCQMQLGSSYHDVTYGNSLVVSGSYIYIGYSYSNGSDTVSKLAMFYNSSLSSSCSSSFIKEVEINSSDGGNESIKALLKDTSGNIYAVGQTTGDLGGSNQGSEDFFVVKYSSTLTKQWTYQGGSSASDIATAAVMTTSGYLLVAGYTSGDFKSTNEGGTDAVYVKIKTSDGSLLGGEQFGTSGNETQVNVIYNDDSSGNINILGQVGVSGTMNSTSVTAGETFNATFTSSGSHVATYKYCGTGHSQAAIPLPMTVDSKGYYYIQTYGVCSQLTTAQMPSSATTQYLLKTSKSGVGQGGYAHSGGDFTIYSVFYDSRDETPIGAGSYFGASDGSIFGGFTVDIFEDAVGGHFVPISSGSVASEF